MTRFGLTAGWLAVVGPLASVGSWLGIRVRYRIRISDITGRVPGLGRTGVGRTGLVAHPVVGPRLVADRTLRIALLRLAALRLAALQFAVGRGRPAVGAGWMPVRKS